MTDYLARFGSKNWRKLDPELIRRWEWDARCNGDKNIKTQASNARRAATTMQKTREQFTNLKPEHELAINAAASALRAMADELTLLAGWAKDYFAFCTAERKKEEDARIEALAWSRWGDDEKALNFECDLMNELSTNDGQLAFAAWCHSVGKYPQCNLDEIRCRIDRLLHGTSQRIKAALTIERAMDMPHANLWQGLRGPTVVCGWADYEAYLAYRKEVDQASARIMAVASRQS